MPLCPKCHKNISEKHFQRHLRRCGTSHKHYTGELYVPSATPAWERPDRGILVSAPGDKPKWAIYIIYVILVALVASLLLVFVQVVVSPQATKSTSTVQIASTSSVSSTMIVLSSPASSGLSGVTPMEMKITGLSAQSSSPGQSMLVVTIAATNNIGAVYRNYTNVIVTLKSLDLNVSYQYTSSSGNSEHTTFAVALTPILAMLTDEQTTLSVAVAPLPVSVVGPIAVQVSGRPTWILQATLPDGSQEIGYGKGLIPQFDGTVTAP